MVIAMMGMTVLGMVLITGILTAEVLIVGQQGGRLSWPYGDLVPGNYLAKAGLPAFCVLVALAVSGKKPVNALATTISFITVILSVITGERINFLLRACGGMMAALMWRPNWRRYIILIVVEILAISAVFYMSPTIQNRYVDIFINQLPTGPHSPYYRVFATGPEAAKEFPLLGLGPATFRDLCPKIIGSSPEFKCHNHSHNFYIQLWTETGFVGLVAGSLMMASITWAAFVGWRRNRANVVAATAFVIPFGLFFPIQSTADFFGQWNNVFMWSAIAIALAAARTLVPHDRK